MAVTMVGMLECWLVFAMVRLKVASRVVAMEESMVETMAADLALRRVERMIEPSVDLKADLLASLWGGLLTETRDVRKAALMADEKDELMALQWAE